VVIAPQRQGNGVSVVPLRDPRVHGVVLVCSEPQHALELGNATDDDLQFSWDNALRETFQFV